MTVAIRLSARRCRTTDIAPDKGFILLRVTFSNDAAPTALLTDGPPIEPRTMRNTRTVPNKIPFRVFGVFRGSNFIWRFASVFNLWLKKNMPTDLIHRIGIAAPAETIHRTLTTT